MKYANPPASIPKERRADINQKLLTLIRQGDLQGLTHEEVHAAYTGLGGLHGLKRSEYRDYHSYSKDKRERELGQFFTPSHVTTDIVRLLDPQPGQVILDLAVGHGAFINAIAGHHPSLETTFYGCDVDADALTVAKFLYPDASLAHEDLAGYHPGTLADMVIGNPPYALTLHYGGQNWRSEFLYLHRASELLKPGGLLALVVPQNFLNNDFHDKSHLARLNSQYRYLTRYALPEGTFDAKIDTSVLILQRASEHLPDTPIDVDHLDTRTIDEIRAQVIEPAKAVAEAVRVQLARETKNRNAEDQALIYAIEKGLYHLTTNPRMGEAVREARALFERALHECKPDGMNQKEWEAKRITLPKVHDVVRQALREQHTVERDEIRLVKTNAGIRLKGYSAKRRAQLEEEPETAWSWGELANGERHWPHALQQNPLRKAARRKLRRHERHQGELATSTPDKMVVERLMLEPLHKSTPTGTEAFRLTRGQAEDTARVMDRDYAYLALGMGSGKTAMGYMWARQKASSRDLVVILAPALAIHQTWVPFLDANEHPHHVIKNRGDALAAQAGETLLVSMSLLATLKPWLKATFRRHGRRVVLLVDESDELANFDTRQTQAALATFARAKAKLLMTGTITRNAIRESYSQLALLYNASTLFLSLAPVIYEQSKDGDLDTKSNPQWGEPYVHRAGLKNFTASYNPTRATVFGIQKQVQDVHNLETLSGLMKRTLIRRSFTDVVGEGKYTIRQHVVPFNPHERALHQRLMVEFEQFLAYFESTGDARKDAGLRAVRQLRLLIESCLHPHLFKDYEGAGHASKFHATRDLIHTLPADDRILLGVPRRQVFDMDYLQHWADFLAPTNRKMFTLHGGMSFRARQDITKEFLQTDGAILIASMEAMRSSVNLRGTRHVIMPALGWNVPRIQQFAFRAVRFDNEFPTTINFVTHRDSIETNLWKLLMSKEIGNLAVAEGRVPTRDEISKSLEIDPDLLATLLQKERDEDGNVKLAWVSNLLEESQGVAA